MSKPNYVYWATTLMMLVFAYAAYSFVDSYSKSIQPGSFRSFAVSGEGKVVAVPDVARFTFSVITQGSKDIAILQRDNTSKVNKIINFIKASGVEEKDITTQNYDLSPRYQTYGCQNGVCPPSEIVGYTISQSVEVKIRDFSKIGDVLAGVVQNGANNVSRLSFTIDDPEMIKSKAREEAILRAKAKAEKVAQAGGFALGRLLSIEETDFVQPFYGRGGDFGVIALEAKALPAPTIEPGSQDVRVSLILRYEIR